jgi:hypothetical protein
MKNYIDVSWVSFQVQGGIPRIHDGLLPGLSGISINVQAPTFFQA